MKNNINNHILFLVFCMPLVLQAMEYDVENQKASPPTKETVCYRRNQRVSFESNPVVVIEIFEEVKYKKEYPKIKGFGCSDVLRAGCFTCMAAITALLMGEYNE